MPAVVLKYFAHEQCLFIKRSEISWENSQQAHNVESTLIQRWYNVMILNQGWFNVESNCVPAGFIKFVVLHSFVIMIFAFANNVQIVLYLYSRRLERKKYLGSDTSYMLCQRVQPDKIPWYGWKLGASVPRCKQTISSAPWIPPVQIWMILVLLVYSKGSILVESLSIAF